MGVFAKLRGRLAGLRTRFEEYDSPEARRERAEGRLARRHRDRDGSCDVERVVADLAGDTTSARKRRWAMVCFSIVAFDVAVLVGQIALAVSEPSAVTWGAVGTYTVIYGAFGGMLIASGIDDLREAKSPRPGYFMRSAATKAVAAECAAGGERRTTMLVALAGRWDTWGVGEAMYDYAPGNESAQVCQALAAFSAGGGDEDWLLDILERLERPVCEPVADRLEDERPLEERFPTGGDLDTWRSHRLVNGPSFDAVLAVADRLEAAGDHRGLVFSALAARTPAWRHRGSRTEDVTARVEALVPRLAVVEGAVEVFCGLMGDWHGDEDAAVEAALLVAAVERS